MNIIVCIKQVPDTETIIKISASGTDIEAQGIKYVVNPYDEFAIEEAVRIKERISGSTVTVLSIGPARSKEAIRTCLAMGADNALHLCDDEFLKGDGNSTANILAAQIREMPFDLILVGKQAIDDDCAQVGSALASILNLPFVSVINKLELSSDNKKATVKREIEGATEIFEVELPALFSCQKGLNEPRYPALKDIMMSKKKEIKEIKASDLKLTNDAMREYAKTMIVKMDYPPKRPPGQKLEGEPKNVVEKLLKLLRDEAKVM